MVLTLVGWLAAVNTANDVIDMVQGSMLFGTVPGAKANREMLGGLAGGVIAGAIGAGLTAFGVGIAATAMRRTEAWVHGGDHRRGRRPLALPGGVCSTPSSCCSCRGRPRSRRRSPTFSPGAKAEPHRFDQVLAIRARETLWS